MNKKQLLSVMIGIALCGSAVYALRFAGPPKTPEEARRRQEMAEKLGHKAEPTVKVVSENPYTVMFPHVTGLYRKGGTRTHPHFINVKKVIGKENVGENTATFSIHFTRSTDAPFGKKLPIQKAEATINLSLYKTMDLHNLAKQVLPSMSIQRELMSQDTARLLKVLLEMADKLQNRKAK